MITETTAQRYNLRLETQQHRQYAYGSVANLVTALFADGCQIGAEKVYEVLGKEMIDSPVLRNGEVIGTLTRERGNKSGRFEQTTR
jgi:hypothetical protein